MGLFKKRACAYIIDFFVVSAFMWVIAYIAYFAINYFNMFQVYHYAIIVLPIITVLYFTFMEGSIGATIGKRLMFIEVVSTNSRRYTKPSYSQAFIRSLSKIYWFIIIFDILLGKISKNTRILDKISRTTVVEEGRNKVNINNRSIYDRRSYDDRYNRRF